MSKRLRGVALILPVVLALLCLVGTQKSAAQKSGAQKNNSNSNGGEMTVPGQLSTIHLVSPVPNGQWTLPAGDYANTRYSPLDEINTQNVNDLKVVATMSTGIAHGHEGQPLYVNGTLYIVTPFPNNLIAVDTTKPGFPIKWIYHPYPDPEAQGVACCDTVNRGASYGDGKIVYATLDNHIVAVDANTGKLVWSTLVGDIHKGETTTGAPLIVKNVVITGDSGGELGVRGKVVALDLKTGKEVWRAYSTGPDEDVLIGPASRRSIRKTKAKI